ncbi:MAG: ABC transporter ATP-binding protein [candidate division KSB1 bacterium]|nr:ABC transporter ATP-binding protein [candidate division KSB1 bacterium]MDZ7304130.1 ABC transporter ATP-binding protein [candidate division KSB1 bacterium]MDZ7314085.1 ABC transporter ATP-binding protein [candidate division KSB1 bacterium]
MIEFRDVHKSFDDNYVLRGINLSVHEGELISILGPSGCGKSVTLKHIIGILKPDRGEVWVDGQLVPRLSRTGLQELRKKIGVLFQSAALFDSMSVKENVAFMLRMHTKMTEAEIDHRVRECLEEVELHGVESLNPDELSGGMRKRVGLARAIAMKPNYILYDEPTTGLDPKTAIIIGELVVRLQKHLKITSVVVTHDVKLATGISDRLALFHEGKVAAVGAPEEISRGDSDLIRRFMEGQL